MTELEKKTAELAKLKNDAKALNWRIHKLEGEIDGLQHDADNQKAQEFNFHSPGDYRKYKHYVEIGYIDWHGNVLKPYKMGQKAGIWIRGHFPEHKPAEWTLPVPGFRRNLYLAMFNARWHSQLAHEHLLNEQDHDYQRFLREGFGPLTDADLHFIKSGPKHDNGGLGFGG